MQLIRNCIPSHAVTSINKCKEKLESLYDYIPDEIILRSRATWYEKGEQSTKYFLNLEERNKTKSHVSTLENLLILMALKKLT